MAGSKTSNLDAGGVEAPSSDWTETKEKPSAPSTPTTPETGFTPGTMLAGRYRVVAQLGRGGMGDVYRADDVKLDHPVALKFLRGDLSPALLERLYAEVRIGRQVSHPNVCRLYDIVEVEGRTFLAMEYVDGEDLASLLSRIGRLPPDKALEIARDLCAGLAAAHAKGVVHRDLKPANVMIDGRGRARLTDFGLAVATGAGKASFAGTPAYMSPEQLAGAEVTFKSDLYALGLVLYEMLSGRRFFEATTAEDLRSRHREAKAPKLSSVVKLLDPAVERVIVQCLDEDPLKRPESAAAVVGLLPGADPLEAAVAAGETPSPDMVAAAGQVGDLSHGVAWAALLAVLALLAVEVYLFDRTMMIATRPTPKSPEVLVERSREVLMRLGRTDPAMDWAASFEWDEAHVSYVAQHDRAPDRWHRLREAPLGPLHFFYRQSPRRLIAANRDAMVRREDPPADVSGMLEVVLDPQGRLQSFTAVPPQVEDVAAGGWPEPSWSPFFQEAGLDAQAFKPVAPRWAAPVDSDRKAAWEGLFPGSPETPVRVEAASYHGRPVWFAILTPWAAPDRMAESRNPSSRTPVGQVSVMVFALAMPFGGVLLARRNLRMGRGDRKGAFRVALFVFVAYSIARMFRADHVSAFGSELWILIKVIAYPAFWAALIWLLYMALEPYARRRWPHMLISWKRLLTGHVRDPLVGRDLLLGGLAGLALTVSFVVAMQAPAWFSGEAPVAPAAFLYGPTLTSLRHVAFRLFVNQYSAVLFAMVYLFMFVLIRMIVRRTWLAVLVWCLLVATPFQGGSPVYEWAGGVVRSVTLLLVLMRCGLLGMVAALFFMFASLEAPYTLDFGAWYGTRALPILLTLGGLAAYGFHTALAGKPMFGRSLLED